MRRTTKTDSLIRMIDRANENTCLISLFLSAFFAVIVA